MWSDGEPAGRGGHTGQGEASKAAHRAAESTTEVVEMGGSKGQSLIRRTKEQRLAQVGADEPLRTSRQASEAPRQKMPEQETLVQPLAVWRGGGVSAAVQLCAVPTAGGDLQEL